MGNLKCSSMPSVPKRYIISIMGFLAIVISHLMRAVLSVAILQMVKPTNTQFGLQKDVYPKDVYPKDLYPKLTLGTHSPEQLFYWSEQIQGILLGSFYLGYALGHIPGACIVEKFGVKGTLGSGMLLSWFFTIWTPYMVQRGDWPWLILARILVGFGEGIMYPSLSILMVKWLPLSERPTIATLMYSGLALGTAIANATTGFLIGKTASWEIPFYMFGVCGLIWSILWAFLGYSDPDSHPFISQDEKQYLDDNDELDSASPARDRVQLKTLLSLKSLWVLVLVNFGFSWGLYTMLAELPKYMKTVLKFTVEQSGIGASLPFVMMWVVSVLFTWLCSKQLMKQAMSVALSRNLIILTSMVGCGSLLMVASLFECNSMLSVLSFTLGMGLLGITFCSINSTNVKLLQWSPIYAGTLSAIVNGIGALGGVITPCLVGIAAKNQTPLEWKLVFWVTLLVFIITSIVLVLFGSQNEDHWNSVFNIDNNLELRSKRRLFRQNIFLISVLV